MKYSLLGFKQDILVEKYKELNASDIIVLQTMVDMLQRLPRTIEIDGKVYVQMSYKILLSDLPFITGSLSTIKRIVQKLIDNELIERFVVKKGGNYTYFRVTENLKELQYGAKKDESKDIKSPGTPKEDNITEEQLLQAIAYTREEIKSLSNEYGAIELMEARAYVLEKYKNGSQINNPLAYLKHVLKKRYYNS